MKKFLAGLITAVALSFFVFPVEFTFLPSALNSKMIMAGWGVLVFLYRCIRERRVEIPRIIFISGLLAALFSLWCLIAVTLTETYNMEYVSYIKSFLTWVFGALGACAVMKFCTGKDDLPTLTKYLAIVCVSQCVLALLFDNVPFTVSLANRLFFTGSDFYRSGGRLFGIGCALDVAGVRFSAILLLVAHQIATNAQAGGRKESYHHHAPVGISDYHGGGGHDFAYHSSGRGLGLGLYGCGQSENFAGRLCLQPAGPHFPGGGGHFDCGRRTGRVSVPKQPDVL